MGRIGRGFGGIDDFGNDFEFRGLEEFGEASAFDLADGNDSGVFTDAVTKHFDGFFCGTDDKAEAFCTHN